jgi:hypothetical protein
MFSTPPLTVIAPLNPVIVAFSMLVKLKDPAYAVILAIVMSLGPFKVKATAAAVPSVLTSSRLPMSNVASALVVIVKP